MSMYGCVNNGSVACTAAAAPWSAPIEVADTVIVATTAANVSTLLDQKFAGMRSCNTFFAPDIQILPANIQAPRRADGCCPPMQLEVIGFSRPTPEPKGRGSSRGRSGPRGAAAHPACKWELWCR